MADFGWAASLNDYKRSTYCGTVDYLAPEIIAGTTYGFEVDIWSVGVLSYELCAGEAPFNGSDNKKTRENIRKMEFKIPDHFSAKLGGFVVRILTPDPKRRPTIKEVLKDPWLLENVKRYREIKKQSNHYLNKNNNNPKTK